LRRVPGNEKADGLQVVKGQWGPPYFSHFAMRWRASS
jgi:hypothetical protein